ncbi:hypothetical protein BC833DRAFT_541914 [Globomyces pollinis-pini]|nr:hypothetical protein BC833DRAFT_541914 [Globomyces pollinis-pini]
MGGHRVYFGKLARDCRERDLEKLTREFGRVRDIRLLQGFAFVEFADSRDADDCIHELDGTRFLGERLIVEMAKGKADRDRRDDRRDDRRRSPVRKSRVAANCVNVHGLPRHVSWQDLKDLMRKAGEVQYANVDSRDIGLVEFMNYSGKEEATKMFENYDYQGSIISLKDDHRDRSPRRDDRRERSPRREDRRRDSVSRSPEKRRSRTPEKRSSVSPRRDSPRRDSPRRDSPRRDSPRRDSPRRDSPQREESPRPMDEDRE